MPVDLGGLSFAWASPSVAASLGDSVCRVPASAAASAACGGLGAGAGPGDPAVDVALAPAGHGDLAGLDVAGEGADPAADVGAVGDVDRRDEDRVGADEAVPARRSCGAWRPRRSWRRSCRPRCWRPRRWWRRRQYVRCGTLAPSPILAFLVSTKPPILPLAPSSVPGRR